MRQYRAWDKKAESYIEHGFDIRIDGDGYIYRRIWGETEWQRTSDIDIEFSTGLKDKNGQELDWWEGDVFDHPSGKCVIKWHDGGLYMHGSGGYAPVGDATDWAEDLIEHFENMGNPKKGFSPARCSIPIETDKGCYIIEVRKTL